MKYCEYNFIFQKNPSGVLIIPHCGASYHEQNLYQVENVTIQQGQHGLINNISKEQERHVSISSSEP